MQMGWEQIKGWGETHAVKSLVMHASSVVECIRCLEFAKTNGLTIIPVGAGYSFGDLGLNSNNVVLKTSGMNKLIYWDELSGLMTVQPGLTISDVFLKSLPSNWTLDSVPGGLDITVAGAVANNVHGKDSWKKGNFGDQVKNIKLLTSDGNIVSVDRYLDRDLFYATVGGMGLLGIIVEVTLQLTKVMSHYVACSQTPTKNLQQTLQVLESSAPNSDFMIAWVDQSASGPDLGRGYVSSARYIDSSRIIEHKTLIRSLSKSNLLFGLFPTGPTWKVLSYFNAPPVYKFLNFIIYYSSVIKKILRRSPNLQFLPNYLFPHNSIPDLNHLMRPHGFIEVQFLFRESDALSAIEECIDICQQSNICSPFSAIKKHRGDDYFISFSDDGYTFDVVIPLKGNQHKELQHVLKRFFDISRRFSAKIYLAKDEFLPKELFKTIYPSYKEFLSVKNRYDPEHLFSSDLFRRLIKDD